MLTDRQKLSIENLKKSGIKKPLEIIKWCIESIGKGRSTVEHRRSIKEGRETKPGKRRHSIKYFQEIINHYAQGNK